MANDSSTGGFLPPAGSPAPVEDLALDAVVQQLVVGITGLPGNLVRPRWQPTVPKQPEASTNWCAIGVLEIEPDNAPAIIHQAAGNGADLLRRDERVTVLASFYGPAGMANAALLRDGLYLAQNNDFLSSNGIGLVDTTSIVPAPELVNQQWIRRWDMRVRFYRVILRSYPVLNLLHAQATIFNDGDAVTVTAGV
ncbi:MAG: hypothetical protein KGH75_02435 [Rhodospirillales bacterium]|nr:hypothetical protein [Rhodospirillales bacterium]